MKKIFIALMLCVASVCSWAAPTTTTFGSGSKWIVDYSKDVDLYIDIKDQNDWNSLGLNWNDPINVNDGKGKRVVIVGPITVDVFQKFLSVDEYKQCFATSYSLNMANATFVGGSDSQWESLKSQMNNLWFGDLKWAHSTNNVVTGKIYYPGDAFVHNTDHVTLSSSFDPDDVCDIHPCGDDCKHYLTDILLEAGITEKSRFDLVKVSLDYVKNKKFAAGIAKINAFAIDLTGVTSLYDWAGIKNQYVSNIILPHTVKDPLEQPTLEHNTGRIIYDKLPLTKKVKNNFNQDKLYNVIVVENCIECHEIHIDAYVNKPGFLATGLQYVPALEPKYNIDQLKWYNKGIENHAGRGYLYDTRGVTRLKLLGCVFARDLKGTSFENVDANGHLIPFGDYVYQNLTHFKAGMCTCELAPSKKNPNCKSGVHVNYLPEGTKGYSDQTFMSENANAGQVHTFDLTEAEFGYYDQNGVFQYYPADMTLSELQYFDSWRSVAHIDLPTSGKQFIIPEAFLQRSKYVRELCIPHNYTEIHRYAFLAEGIDTLRNEDGEIYGYRGGISHFTTTAATDDEMLSRRKGDRIDYGDKTVAFPSTTKYVGRGSFAGYDGAALFEDVYCLAPKAPICEFFAFDQKTYVGDNYHHKGHLIKKGNYVNVNMAMLHFPNTVDEDGRLDRIEMLKYSDMTRKYRLYDETGRYDNVGNILVWPTQQQYNRSFNQALAGVTWKAWNEYLPTVVTDQNGKPLKTKEGLDSLKVVDNPENAFSAGTVAGGGYQFANHEYMFPHSLECDNGKGISEAFIKEFNGFFDGSEAKGSFGLTEWDAALQAKSVAHEQTDRPLTYDWENYGGWHQFVIAELYDFLLDDPDPDKPEPKSYFNFSRYNKNIWYSICFPFNLTKAQLLKAFGNPEEDEYPYLSTLASVVRDARGPKIKVVMSSNLLKKNLVYDEKCPNTVKYGSDFKPQYTDVNYDDNDIVIEANKPYFILPALPAEEIAKAAFLGEDYSRRVETTPVEMKDNKPLFPVPTHVHAVNGTYSSFVDGQDKEVSDTTYAYNYYFVGNYIPKEMEMPEYAYYLAPSKKSNGDDWSSFYINSPKKNGLLWTENSCIVMAKIDDNTSSHSGSKGELYPVEKSYTYNYKWIATPHNDDIFFAGTVNETHAKSSFGIRVEDDYTTSIQLPDDFVISENNKVYNLNGQFVGLDSDNMPKGIYVVGGKKVVVK